MNANYVYIGGQAYSPKHPLVKLMLKEAHKPIDQQSGVVIDYEIPPKPRSQLNQTEQRYFEILKQRFPMGHVRAHGIKLEIAERCWYEPDFSYVLPQGATVFVETKGAFERDDAIVKLKAVARQFPQFTFIKAQYKKGKWKETVMPK